MIYVTLFLEFFKIGLFTFGGGYAMIPLVMETVTNHGWMTAGQVYDFIGVCESTPGPVAVNMATFVGSTQGGILGSVVATLGVVMPSVIIITLIAAVLKNLTENKIFKGFVFGVNPVVVALITSVGLTLITALLGYTAPTTFKADPVSIGIFLFLVAAYFIYKRIAKKKMPVILLIALSAILGIVVYSILG